MRMKDFDISLSKIRMMRHGSLPCTVPQVSRLAEAMTTASFGVSKRRRTGKIEDDMPKFVHQEEEQPRQAVSYHVTDRGRYAEITPLEFSDRERANALGRS